MLRTSFALAHGGGHSEGLLSVLSLLDSTYRQCGDSAAQTKNETFLGGVRRRLEEKVREAQQTPDHRLLTKVLALERQVATPPPAAAPSERIYCVCQEADDGRPMIACDNEHCPVEWFHMDCIGVGAVPTESWYCVHCAETAPHQ
jgi:PHD-finger